jgi:hypothetical protein
MRRVLPLFALAAAAAGCVSVEGLPSARGALKPDQRLVVAVYPAPGPWIIGSADTKAESAAKISPLGFLVQTAENEHTLSVSKNLQQYLPRPRLGQAVQDSLLKALRVNRSTVPVQTAAEAGIAQAQLAEWNKSRDQLDWRLRYYAPDPDAPAPRDYAKVLTLDDAIILDVNVSFGTDATEDGKVQPTMSAASRAYRGDTSHLLWEHEDVATDQASSATLSDYQVEPWRLTNSLQILAPTLGTNVANSFLGAFGLLPSTMTVRASTTAVAGAPPGHGGGLVDMSVFQHMSTAAPAGVSSPMIPLMPGVAASSSTAAGVASSSTTTAASPAAAPATASSSTTTAPGSSPPPTAGASASSTTSTSPPPASQHAP